MKGSVRTKVYSEGFDFECSGIAQQPRAKLRELVVGNVLKKTFNWGKNENTMDRTNFINSSSSRQVLNAWKASGPGRWAI